VRRTTAGRPAGLRPVPIGAGTRHEHMTPDDDDRDPVQNNLELFGGKTNPSRVSFSSNRTG
jgi:hypothetical protein